MRATKVSFPNAEGVELAARLEEPDGEARACALFAHCFTCSKDIAAASRISRALRGRGIAVLRFDFTGLGNSDGDFANTNFSSNVQDLLSAAEFMRGRGQAPSLLVGHSLGGAAVLAAAGDIPEVRAVATIGAPAEPAHLQHIFQDDLETIERDGEARVSIAGRGFRIKKQFLDDIAAQRIRGRITDLERALIVFHSPVDNVVGLDQARSIFEAAKHPKSFVSLDDADHLLTDAKDAEYVAAVLTAWASRYLGLDPEAEPIG